MGKALSSFEETPIDVHVTYAEVPPMRAQIFIHQNMGKGNVPHIDICANCVRVRLLCALHVGGDSGKVKFNVGCSIQPIVTDGTTISSCIPLFDASSIAVFSATIFA